MREPFYDQRRVQTWYLFGEKLMTGPCVDEIAQVFAQIDEAKRKLANDEGRKA